MFIYKVYSTQFLCVENLTHYNSEGPDLKNTLLKNHLRHYLEDFKELKIKFVLFVHILQGTNCKTNMAFIKQMYVSFVLEGPPCQVVTTTHIF